MDGFKKTMNSSMIRDSGNKKLSRHQSPPPPSFDMCPLAPTTTPSPSTTHYSSSEKDKPNYSDYAKHCKIEYTEGTKSHFHSGISNQSNSHPTDCSQTEKTENSKKPKKNTQIFKCSECPKEFKNNTDLARHLQIHSGKKPYQCNHCLKKFALSSYLIVHLRTHFEEKVYLCPICYKNFTTASNLNRHVRTHSKTSNQYFNCSQCTKKFLTLDNLNLHKKTHYEPKPFKCSNSNCEKTFSNIRNARLHFVRMHSNAKDKLYQCPDCEKSFASKSFLKSHQDVHSSDYPFECKPCNKTFKRNKDLSAHLKTHEKTTEFTCPVCNKILSAKNKLKNHMALHERDGILENLNGHLKSHKIISEGDEECYFCGATFLEWEKLNDHIANHIGEKPFKCYQTGCEKWFKDQNSLISHKLEHSEEEPIQIKSHLGEKSFKSLTDFKSPEKMHFSKTRIIDKDPDSRQVLIQNWLFGKSEMCPFKI